MTDEEKQAADEPEHKRAEQAPETPDGRAADPVRKWTLVLLAADEAGARVTLTDDRARHVREVLRAEVEVAYPMDVADMDDFVTCGTMAASKLDEVRSVTLTSSIMVNLFNR